MNYATSTHAQRLAWDHGDLTHGYEADPSLSELSEVQDAEFRHWDQHHFAPASAFADLGRDHRAREDRRHSSDSFGGGPELTQPVAPLAGGAAVFPPGGRSALIFEHHMWTA